MACKCLYVHVSGNLFCCHACGSKHMCDLNCEYVSINNDRMWVCEKTGKCFGQRVLYSNTPSIEPTTFDQNIFKRPQQNKNSILRLSEIQDIFNEICVDTIIKDSNLLMYNIANLWEEIVLRKLIKSIRRNDKESIILACLFSTRNGLYNNLHKEIIQPSNLDIIVLNKKKSFNNNLNVKRLRYGQKLLRNTFADIEHIENPILQVYSLANVESSEPI